MCILKRTRSAILLRLIPRDSDDRLNRTEERLDQSCVDRLHRPTSFRERSDFPVVLIELRVPVGHGCFARSQLETAGVLERPDVEERNVKEHGFSSAAQPADQWHALALGDQPAVLIACSRQDKTANRPGKALIVNNQPSLGIEIA